MKDITLLEECVLLVINLVRLVQTTQPNVLHALIIILAQTEDVLDHALKELILMVFQRLADHVILHVPLAAQKNTV